MSARRSRTKAPASPTGDVEVVRGELTALYQRIYELEQRLGGAGEEAAPPAGDFEALACRVGDDLVLLRLDEVREVVPRPALAELPEAPPWVPGLMNLRGDAIPVLDALARAERRNRAADPDDLVVVCTLKTREVGVLVQAVHDVLRLASDDLQMSFEHVALAPYVVGSIETPLGLALLLSVERLLRFVRVPEAREGDAA